MLDRNQANDFAQKFRLALEALNWSRTRCARELGVNKSVISRWASGDATPTEHNLTRFTAALQQADARFQPGAWRLDVARFGELLAALTAADVATPVGPDSLSPRVRPRVAGLFGGIETLAGAFAAYSPAWSPHFRGSLVRGALRLTAGGGGGLIATYTEALVGRELRLTGEVQINGRSMHITVCDPDGDMPLYISVPVPGPPASVLCGIMSGVAFVSHEALPSACRIIFVRVPETTRLDATNRYLEPDPGAIATDLAGLAINLAQADRLDGFTREFLGAWPIQVTSQDQATFASMLDREHLRTAGRSSDLPELNVHVLHPRG